MKIVRRVKIIHWNIAGSWGKGPGDIYNFGYRDSLEGGPVYTGVKYINIEIKNQESTGTWSSIREWVKENVRVFMIFDYIKIGLTHYTSITFQNLIVSDSRTGLSFKNKESTRKIVWCFLPFSLSFEPQCFPFESQYRRPKDRSKEVNK